jgi:hypothetical protein
MSNAADVLFGIHGTPKGRLPTHVGSKADDVPDGFWAQLAYPFRRSTSVRAATRQVRRVMLVPPLRGKQQKRGRGIMPANPRRVALRPGRAQSQRARPRRHEEERP